MKAKNAIVWGDSLARGVVFDENRGRYILSSCNAATMISEKLGIEIKNRSRMGMTSQDGIVMMQKDLEKGLKADVAVIEFGGNDCDFDWKAISMDPNAKYDPKTTIESYEQNIRGMIQTARQADMEPVLINLTPVHAENYFRFITRDGLSQENILQWLGDTFQIYRYQERYSILLSRLARECGCRLFDIRSAFLSVWDCTSALFCIDGIHPTEEGHRLIGNSILESL